jgi:hypothetical protein
MKFAYIIVGLLVFLALVLMFYLIDFVLHLDRDDRSD